MQREGAIPTSGASDDLNGFARAYLRRRYTVLFYTLLVTMVAAPIFTALKFSGTLIESLLAACLLAVDDPAEALRHYERLRLPRVTRLQEMSRANKTRFHMRDGPAQQARDAEWASSGDRSPDTLRWLYDYDSAAVERVPA